MLLLLLLKCHRGHRRTGRGGWGGWGGCRGGLQPPPTFGQLSFLGSKINLGTKLLKKFPYFFDEIALGNICHSETPGKENVSRVAKFYKIDGEILEAEQKMYVSFRHVRGLGYMTAD